MAAKVIEHGRTKCSLSAFPTNTGVCIGYVPNARQGAGRLSERLKQIIIEDVVHGQCDEGTSGVMLLKGWEETLKDDTYCELMTKS